MDFLETLASRNADFAETSFNADLKMLPSRRTMIIGCVDPRVDPMDVLKLEPGETAVIRNVGGRVNPALLETMAILGTVSRAAGEAVGLAGTWSCFSTPIAESTVAIITRQSCCRSTWALPTTSSTISQSPIRTRRSRSMWPHSKPTRICRARSR